MNVFKRLAVLAATAACALPAAANAQADKYPTRPIRMLVPFAPGGGTDITARLIAANATAAFGQQVIIDNRAGANGLIGADAVAKSAPDGYTMILITTGTATISPHLYKKMAYDAQRDLVAVTLVTSTPELLVIHPSLPAKNMREFIALAKARPGEITLASTGSGGLPHLAQELLRLEAKINTLHVPFNGAAPAIANTVGGQVLGVIADLPVVQPHVQNGKLRAIAIAAPKRSPLFPDVQTMKEQGLPKVEAVNWYGIQVAAKTPPEIIAKLNEAFGKTLADPDMRQKLIARGADPIPGTAAEFAAFLKSEYERWGPIARESGAKVE